MGHPAWPSRVAGTQSQRGLSRLAPFLVATQEYQANRLLAVSDIAVGVDHQGFVAFTNRSFEIASCKNRLSYASARPAIELVEGNRLAG